jgi:hypothetical protein
MEISSNATSPHGTRINTSSVAIVELILDSLPKPGSPARVLFTYLQASFVSNPNDIKLFSRSFEVDPDDQKSHQRKIRTLVTELNK